MLKKSIALILSAILSVAALAACSSGQTAASSGTAAGVTTEAAGAAAGTVTTDSTAASDSSSTGEKLVVGLDDAFPPMGFRDEDGNLTGFDVEMAQAVGARLGMEVVLQPINWNNKEMELANGNVDVLWNGLTITDARKESMLLSEPYLANAQIILVKADSDITTKDDLQGATICYQSGSSAQEAFEGDSLKDIVGSVVESDDNVKAMEELDLGRIDAVILDKVVAEYYMNLDNKKGKFRMLDDELAAEEYGIAFKKGNQELYDKVMGAFKELVADGTAASISEKWFGEDRVILK
ncbi:amino acid ABC transporter substrate-binding protein [Oscillospiraceae bacterium HV4-5-C5C]|nr:amino acid ABC transporter substrate-binding protein [Oscillospiraceae bacterium HV4-5-C5C]